MHRRGAQGLDPGHNPAQRALLTHFSQSIPTVLHSPYWRYIDHHLQGIVRNHEECAGSFQGQLRMRFVCLPAASSGLDQRPALPDVHPPPGRVRDLPLVVFNCDARPANAASQICLINVTPILRHLTFARKASGRNSRPFFTHLQAASGQQRQCQRHRPRCRCFGHRSWLYISVRSSSPDRQRACG